VFGRPVDRLTAPETPNTAAGTPPALRRRLRVRKFPSASSLSIALSSFTSASSFFNRVFSLSKLAQMLRAVSLRPAVGAVGSPSAVSRRLTDLQMPQHLSQILSSRNEISFFLEAAFAAVTRVDAN